MPVPQGYQVANSGKQGPSCWHKMKIGMAMGAMIGLSTGVVLGGFFAFRMNLRGREFARQVGQYAASSGGTFAVFMGVAQGLRC